MCNLCVEGPLCVFVCVCVCMCVCVLAVGTRNSVFEPDGLLAYCNCVCVCMCVCVCVCVFVMMPV